MTPPSDAAHQFLRTRRALVEAGADDGREQLDATLPEIAASDPATALTIMRELSRSEEFTAREAVAIYARHLFAARSGEVSEILVTLLNDANPDISRQALTTIDELTGDPELNADEATRHIRRMAQGE